MKALKKWIKRVWVAGMALFMAVMLSSCTAINLLVNLLSLFDFNFKPPITLEYTLTEEDLEEFKEMAKECKELGLKGENLFAFTASLNELMDKFIYIDGNANVAYLLYSMDMDNEEATADYIASEEMATELRNIYVDLLKSLAESSPWKDDIFAGMPEEDMAMIFADREKIGALQLRNSELTREFYDLAEDENWLKNSAVIYNEMVANNQAMAIEYKYDNYYTLASEMIFARKHTTSDVARFRSHVAKYIVPMISEIYKEYEALQESLTELQKATYVSTSGNYDLVNSYMDGFDWAMQTAMRMMSTTENAALFAEKGKNGLPGAYTMYLDMYEQPVAYFGPGYQDIYTYVHEQGHYVAAQCYEGMVSCYDLAELHSQGNEWLFISYLDGLLDEKVYEAIKLNRTINGLLNVVCATLVDHFEELVYTASTPLKVKDYAQVMQTLYTQYPGVKEAINTVIDYDIFEYVQRVAILHPGYYLNYATSEVAAMTLFATAQQEGYKKAQSIYTSLMSYDLLESTLTRTVELSGLMSPFEESTYQALKNVL